MRLRIARPAAAILVVSALALVACGNDGDDASPSEEVDSTPQTGIAEIGETQKGLAAALATYTSGDQAAAADQVNETYLQHFELVEPPLEEVDPELTEELEEKIREELVGSMEAGDPVPQVSGLVEEIESGLAEATKKLQAA